MIKVAAILGPTASGKSSLAEYLAQQMQGEIINADASAVYRELSVGVTKPSAEARREIAYHLLDVATLEEGFCLTEFLELANAAIDDISARGKLPIVVGGSGLYTRGLLDGYRPPSIDIPEEIQTLARELEPSEALDRLKQLDEPAYTRIDRQNPRRIARALELALAYGGAVPPAKLEPRPDIKICRIYLVPSRELLRKRILQRTLKMWDPWQEEVAELEKKGLSRWLEVRKPIGYRQITGYQQGEFSREVALQSIATQTARLAKKQRTWLRRETTHPDSFQFELNHESEWESVPKKALLLLRQFLS